LTPWKPPPYIPTQCELLTEGDQLSDPNQGGPPVTVGAPRVQRLVQGVPFRVALAVVCLGGHLGAVTMLGQARFGAPFNAAPGRPPAFAHPRDLAPQRWDRLVVGRWDTGSYVGIALRGYDECPSNSLRGADLPPMLVYCAVHFYPGYPLLGRIVSLGGRIPIDYALFIVSLVASFIFLFLWTGPTLVQRLGLWPTYLSFVALNLFTTGFLLVTIQTEPVALALTFGAFLSLARRRTLTGALLAGAATAIRITALATGGAFAAALVALTIVERPTGNAAWARRALEVALSGWGIVTLFVYYGARFGDPFIYMHAHEQSFHHQGSVLQLLAPPVNLVMLALSHPLHEGMWLVGALLWFTLGHRKTLGRFPLPEQVFLYGLFTLTIGIAGYGSVGLAFVGMTRYLLLALPLFMIIGVLTARRPATLALWLLVSTWHYWEADLCIYSGGPGRHTLEQCNQQFWIGRI
jgi:hypothetical protein